MNQRGDRGIEVWKLRGKSPEKGGKPCHNNTKTLLEVGRGFLAKAMNTDNIEANILKRGRILEK